MLQSDLRWSNRQSAIANRQFGVLIAPVIPAKYFLPMHLPYFTGRPCPLILAPMAGVSEAPFRQICRRLGADVLMTEFLSAEAIRRGIRKTLEGAEFEPVERPIGVQIYGADPEAMARAAGIVTEEYAPEFIDINFGCPVKKVVHRNGGSGCLRDLDLVDRIIRATVAATHLPVTVKTRSGWNEITRDPGRRSPAGCRTPAPVPSPSMPVPGPRCSPVRPTGTRSPGWWRRSTSR